MPMFSFDNYAHLLMKHCKVAFIHIIGNKQYEKIMFLCFHYPLSTFSGNFDHPDTIWIDDISKLID